MGDHHATRYHARIKELQAGQGTFVKIDVEMCKRVFGVLDFLNTFGGVRKETFVIMKGAL